ncbi:MAG: hypothetical protein ABL997_19840, partial [Planctomycetota bacterium]
MWSKIPTDRKNGRGFGSRAFGNASEVAPAHCPPTSSLYFVEQQHVSPVPQQLAFAFCIAAVR